MGSQDGIIIKLLKKIKSNQETPSEIDTVSIGLSKASNVLSKTNIIVALIGIALIIIQLNSKVAVEKFNDLLTKDSAILSLTEIQLLRNAKIQEQIDNGNKNRFIGAIFRLGSVIGDAAYAKGQINDGSCVGCGAYLIRDILPVFESQMDNPFLLQNDTMLAYWVNAYAHLNIFGQDEIYMVNENGEALLTEKRQKMLFSDRVTSRIDEITKIKLKRDALSVWSSANAAYLYCGRKLYKDFSPFIKR